MCKLITSVLLSVFLLGTSTNGLIPDYIKVCNRDDPKIEECIVDSIEVLRPRLRDGIPELNVPPLEPLPISTVTLSRGPQSARVDLNITDLKVWGPSTFIIKSIKPIISQNRFEFKALLPKLHFKGHYSINMNVLLLKLKGRGSISGNITNYVCDVVMQGHKVQRDGGNYMQFEKLNIKLTLGQTKFKLDDLFNGDQTLGRLANDVINQNSELFVEEIRPALEKSMSEVFTDVANSITARFKYEELFP